MAGKPINMLPPLFVRDCVEKAIKEHVMHAARTKKGQGLSQQYKDAIEWLDAVDNMIKTTEAFQEAILVANPSTSLHDMIMPFYRSAAILVRKSEGPPS